MNQTGTRQNIITIPLADTPKLGGLGTTVFYNMLKYKEEVAQIDGITGEEETYGDLLQKCIRTAIRMRSEGLKPGDIITICTPNHLNSCIPFLASLFLDVQMASPGATISLLDTVYLLEHVSPKMLFVAPGTDEIVEEALKEVKSDAKLVVFGESEKHLKFYDFLQPSPEEKDFAPVEVEDLNATAVISFSSGTTGLARGVCLNHYSLQASFYQNDDLVHRGEIGLSYGEIGWISMITMMLYHIMTGATRLICPTFHPDEVWNIIKRFKVNVMSLPPFYLIAMCRNGRPEGADTSTLRYMRTGGDSLALEQTLKIRKCLAGTTVFKTYGQTELSGGRIIFRFVNNPEHMRLLLEKPESCGKGMPGFSYKIVDPDTEEILGPNQEGELRIKSKIMMNGYYNMDSLDCWDSDGFLKTGDIAYYDEDECFYIVDRINKMIKFRALHVPPTKLENILLTHPAVESAVVIGLPHKEDGDHPVGIVVLKKSAVENTNAEEIEKYIEDRVEDSQRLRGGVKFVKEFPITSRGKVDRRHLKALVLQGKI